MRADIQTARNFCSIMAPEQVEYSSRLFAFWFIWASLGWIRVVVRSPMRNMISNFWKGFFEPGFATSNLPSGFSIPRQIKAERGSKNAFCRPAGLKSESKSLNSIYTRMLMCIIANEMNFQGVALSAIS